LTSPKQSSTEPDAKRLKRTEILSLSSKLQSKVYTSLDDIKADIVSSSSQIIDGINSKTSSTNPSQSSLALEDRKTIKTVFRVTKDLSLLVEREQAKLKREVKSDIEADELGEEGLTNGNSGNYDDSTIPSIPGGAKTTLSTLATFLGTNSKQVFSSIRDPLSEGEALHNLGGPVASSTDAIEEKFPLREAVLRPGLWQTEVDYPKVVKETKKENLSFGNIFGTFKGLPELPLPKQSKTTTTRKNVVDFVHPLDQRLLADSEPIPLSYTFEPLKTGNWLSYNNVSAVSQPTSSETKQRQRARTLSTGDAKAAIPKEAILAHNQAKVEALFRSVYTSFAPSKDDSAAIVPEAVKNSIWWDRVGRIESLENDLFNEDDFTDNPREEILDESAFEEAIRSWKLEEPTLDTIAKPESIQDKAVDEVLGDISELLETLNAYQTSRNLPLPKSRSALGQNQQISDMTGSPTTPSNAEFDIYSILKSQLVVLISSLPPYAVAKLNGDQLADLNISGALRAGRENCIGGMEVDLPGLKHAADLSIATSSAPAMPSTRSQYSSQYRGQAQSIPRSAQAMPSHYTALPLQSPIRPPQSLPRSLGAGIGTPASYSLTRSAPNSNQRAMQAYPTTPSYGQVNGNRQPYDTNVSNSARYFQNTGPGYSTSHISSARQPSQSNHQQQAQVQSGRPQTYSTPYGATPQAFRSASPLKQPQASYNPQAARPMTPLQQASQPGQQNTYYRSPTASANPMNATSPPPMDAARQASQISHMAHMVSMAQHQLLSQQQQVVMSGRQSSPSTHSLRGDETWQRHAAHMSQDQTSAMARPKAQLQRPSSSTSNRSGSRGRVMRNADGVEDDGEEDELA
jgi:hypothetical protein